MIEEYYFPYGLPCGRWLEHGDCANMARFILYGTPLCADHPHLYADTGLELVVERLLSEYSLKDKIFAIWNEVPKRTDSGETAFSAVRR